MTRKPDVKAAEALAAEVLRLREHARRCDSQLADLTRTVDADSKRKAAERDDLRARIRAGRRAMDADIPSEHGAGWCEQPACVVCRGYAALDLRRKDWRRP